MARSLGSLVVSLGLNAAEFVTGLTVAERDAKRFARSIDQGISTAANLAAVGIAAMTTAAVAGFAAINQLAGQAGHFKDLEESTGASAESLASFAVSAAVAGKSMDDIATFSIRLTKNLTGVDDESKAAGAALTAMGISIKEFKALDPAAQMERLAKALAGFSDLGGGKTSALEALAKGGAQLLPFLKELESGSGKVVILNQKLIEQADEYSDKQAKAAKELNLYAQVAAIQTLPAITNLTVATKEFIKELIGVDAEGKNLRDSDAITSWANKTVQALAFIIDSAQGAKRVFQIIGDTIVVGVAQTAAALTGDMKESVRLGEEWKKRISGILEAPLFSAKLEQTIKKSQDLARQRSVEDRGFKPPSPALKFAGAVAANTDDPTKKILDGQIKALEASIARERDILNARQDFLRDYYQDGRLSLEQYYDQLQAARDTNLQRTLAALGQEIALAEAAKKKALKATDKEGFQNTADAAREKQTTLIQQAVFAEQALSRERDRAAEQYGFQLNELNAKMLELAGNTAAAAAIRFDDQNAVFKRSLESSGNTGALAALAALKEQEVRQKALNDKNREFQLILNGVGIAQERIALAQQTGAIGEFEALTKTSAAAAAQIPRLTAIADKMEAIANAADTLNKDGTINIVKAEQLQAVEQLRLGVERLAAQTDLLKDKFNAIGSGALADAIAAVANGEKSLKQAALDFGKSVSQSITKLVAENLAQKAFGKDGPLSGFGDIFSKLFGGGKDAAGAASATAAATALTTSAAGLGTAGAGLVTSSAALDLSAVGLSGAAAALTAAAAAMGASSAASALGSAASVTGAYFGAAANGTDFSPGGMTWVGERGKELVNLPRGAQVIPNDVLRMKRSARENLTINLTVPRGANTQTARQAANQAVDRASAQRWRG